MLFAGWLCYFLLVLCKFRQRVHPTADYAGVKNHASTYLEALVALIEGALLVGLAIPLWAMPWNNFPRAASPAMSPPLK